MALSTRSGKTYNALYLYEEWETPESYGIYRFTLPDGRKFERIVMKSGIRGWNYVVEKKMVRKTEKCMLNTIHLERQIWNYKMECVF